MKKLLFFAVSAMCWNSLLPSLICSQVIVRTAATDHIALTVRTVHTVLIARIIPAIKNL